MMGYKGFDMIGDHSISADIGNLIKVLKNLDVNENAEVLFDFCHFRPNNVIAWYGKNGYLALDYSNKGKITVAELLQKLETALKTEFPLDPAGKFRPDEDTPVWVDAPGRNSRTRIIGVEVEPSTLHEVIIKTSHWDFGTESV